MAARYLESWEKQRVQNDPLLPHVAEPLYGARMQLFLADTDREAGARARVAYGAYAANYTKPVPVGAAPQPRPDGPRNIYAPGAADFDTARQWERVIVGAPHTVRAYVERYAADSTCNYCVVSFQWGDLNHQEAAYSMELFAREVMPLFAYVAVTGSMGKSPSP